MAENLIKFVQFNSFVDASFWWKLTDHKLHDYKLDESEKSFQSYYTNSNGYLVSLLLIVWIFSTLSGDAEGVLCRSTVDFNSLDVEKSPPPNSVACHGHLFLKNTLESFRNTDKKLLLQEIGNKVSHSLSIHVKYIHTKQIFWKKKS